MGLQGVLAGLLLDSPAHGYQLQATLAAELGPLWVTRASQVYLTLGRMQRDGLVTARRVRQSTRPDRQLLELTARGRAAALEWLERPGPADEVVVRLAVARLALPNRFRDLAETVLAERSAALRSLRELRDEVDGGGFQREAVQAEIFRTQAEVRWLAGLPDPGGHRLGGPRGVARGRAGRRRGRHRPLRFRQEHPAQPRGRPGPADCREGRGARPPARRAARARADRLPCRLGRLRLPGPPPAARAYRGRERGRRPPALAAAPRVGGPGPRAARRRRAGAAHGPPAGAAVRRRAPAGRHRPCAGRQATAAAGRRAHRQPRRGRHRGAAGPARAAPAGIAADGDGRHPRPGRRRHRRPGRPPGRWPGRRRPRHRRACPPRPAFAGVTMAWLALRQLAGRRTSSGLAALGLLVATLGFIVLVSTSQTTRAVLKATSLGPGRPRTIC